MTTHRPMLKWCMSFSFLYMLIWHDLSLGSSKSGQVDIELQAYVNDLPVVLRSGKYLHLNKGDKLVLTSAKLASAGGYADVINFKGFRNSWKSHNSEDDSYQEIDTSKLKLRGDKIKKADLYQITVKREGKVLAEIPVSVERLRLEGMELLINDQSIHLANEQMFQVSLTDKIKLGKISTSDASLDAKATVAMNEIKTEDDRSAIIIKIYYGNYEIGAVKLMVRE